MCDEASVWSDIDEALNKDRQHIKEKTSLSTKESVDPEKSLVPWAGRRESQWFVALPHPFPRLRPPQTGERWVSQVSAPYWKDEKQIIQRLFFIYNIHSSSSSSAVLSCFNQWAMSFKLSEM